MSEFSTSSSRRSSASSCSCVSVNNCDCCRKRINALLQSIFDEISVDCPDHHLFRLKIFRDAVSRFHAKILKDIEKLEEGGNSSSSSFISVSRHSVDRISLTSASSIQTGEIRLPPIGEEGEIPAPRLQSAAVNLNPNQPEIQNVPQFYQNERQNYYNTEFQPFFQTEEERHCQTEYQRHYSREDKPHYNSEEQPFFQEFRHMRHQISETTSSERYQYDYERNEWDDQQSMLRISDIQRITDVFATPDLLYVCDGSKFITSQTMRNGVQQQMSTFKKADFITMTPKVLYFSNCREKKVMKFEDNNVSFLYSSLEWTPNGLAMWGDDKIYICMFNKDKKKGKVVLFQCKNFKLVVEKEIEHKKDKPQIFSHPKFIAVNSKGDVCVSDHLKKCVIAVNTGCTIRFKYKGAFSGKNKPFDPEGLSFDDADNVYVADKNNDRVDIINPNGHWLNSIYDIPLPNCVALNDKNIYITMDGKSNVGRILVIPIPMLRISKTF